MEVRKCGSLVHCLWTYIVHNPDAPQHHNIPAVRLLLQEQRTVFQKMVLLGVKANLKFDLPLFHIEGAIHKTDANGDDLLHLAVKSENEDTVEELLTKLHYKQSRALMDQKNLVCDRLDRAN
eukprot:GHVN01051826.1.p2 GENE.GHVN01051826.1~~GHVN01051826.1.p2  ORF type:complete len:122 (-),score=11.67 GHVN01051826.1:942-1307(-)